MQAVLTDSDVTMSGVNSALDTCSYKTAVSHLATALIWLILFQQISTFCHHVLPDLHTGLLIELSQSCVGAGLQGVKVHIPGATLKLTVPVGEHA